MANQQIWDAKTCLPPGLFNSTPPRLAAPVPGGVWGQKTLPVPPPRKTVNPELCALRASVVKFLVFSVDSNLKRQDMLASHDLPVILTADEQSKLAELARPTRSLGTGVIVDGGYLLPLLPFYLAGTIKPLLEHPAEERRARHRLRAPGPALPARPTTCTATKCPTLWPGVAAGCSVRDYGRGAPAFRAGTSCHPHRLAD
jgi:hypothetical protein